MPSSCFAISGELSSPPHFIIQGGRHSEGAGCHNFLHFLSIKKIDKILRNLKTAACYKAKLSNNLDGHFDF